LSEDDSTTSNATNPYSEDSISTSSVADSRETGKYRTEESQTSSISRSVLVDIVNGKQPARHYTLESITNKTQIFQLFEVLQALSDKADEMTISIKVRAHTQSEFDSNWIRNAIEEPLDEIDIQASTKLE
jgi:hypothetical protein